MYKFEKDGRTVHSASPRDYVDYTARGWKATEVSDNTKALSHMDDAPKTDPKPQK